MHDDLKRKQSRPRVAARGSLPARSAA